MKKYLAFLLSFLLVLPYSLSVKAEDKPFLLNGTSYSTLNEAVKAVNVGDTGNIVLTQDASNSGVIFESGKDITIDLNGNTLTMTNPAVGSSGTETNGFQLLRDSSITFKNGTIKVAPESTEIGILFQNYANLTLDNVAIDTTGSSSTLYAVSCNYGETTIKGNTSISVASGKTALDVYYWPSNGYGDGVSVSFDDSYSGIVNGNISYGADTTSDGQNNYSTMASLNISGNGTFNGEVSTYSLPSGGSLSGSITSGVFTSETLASLAPEGTVLASITNGGATKYVVGSNSTLSEVSKLPAGSTVSVRRGSIDLTSVPQGVIVENQGNGTVSANGTVVSTGESITIPTAVANSSTETESTVASYDDGGPFTKDAAGNVYDRWGNEIWHNPNPTVSTSTSTVGGYQIVDTSDR